MKHTELNLKSFLYGTFALIWQTFVANVKNLTQNRIFETKLARTILCKGLVYAHNTNKQTNILKHENNITITI